MTPPSLKYCSYDPDRHGNDRWYARRRINGKLRKERIEAELPATGIPSPEFMAAYWSALARLESAPATASSTPRESTFAWLWDEYQRSAEWQGYDRLTKQDKRSVLGRWVKPIEQLPFRGYRQVDVERSRDKRVDTPHSANKLVKYLKVFFGWAVKKRHLATNPALGVDKLTVKAGGWKTWTAADVEKYRRRWPLGTQARLALELMLQVGARISDAAQLGRQHEYADPDDGSRWIGFTAHKNRNSHPVRIDQPMLPELIAAIAACDQVGDLTYIVTVRPSRSKAWATRCASGATRPSCAIAARTACARHRPRRSPMAAPQLTSSWRGSGGPSSRRPRPIRRRRTSGARRQRWRGWWNTARTKVSHQTGPKSTVGQFGQKTVGNQMRHKALVGPAGLEPATRPL